MELKNKALQDLYDTLSSGTLTFSPYGESPFYRAFRTCDEALDNMVSFGYLRHLEDEIKKLRHEVSAKDKKNNELQKELDEAKLTVEYFETSRNDWLSRAKHEEDEKTEQEKRADILKSQRDMLKKELDKANEKNQKLQKDRDIWVRNNGEKQAEIAELKNQLETVNDSRYKWAQKWLSTKQNLETKLNEAEVKYRRLEKEHEELTSQYQNLTIENKRLHDGLRGIGYEQGQTDLWDKLQNVNDAKPWDIASFYPDVSCMDDIISWDMEDFLNSYKEWQEQKETERMRNWLDDFCGRRFCKGCPLESEEYKCGCGYSFKRRDRFDLRIIPDEDIKRYYEKANGCGRYTLNDGKLVALPNMEGVKSEEEKHKLEYGDAVRLPWRDRDYMYIGPSKANSKHIRLFDPKNHAVVVTIVTNVKYNGGKIIICDEDDLRKIWKDYE